MSKSAADSTLNKKKPAHVDGGDSDSEPDAVFDNPNALDRTSEDESSDGFEAPSPLREPSRADSPSIEVVETFFRDGREQCRLATGKVVSQYEHLQMVTVGKRNETLRALGLFDDLPVIPKTPPQSLPADFEMPPPRKNPSRRSRENHT